MHDWGPAEIAIAPCASDAEETQTRPAPRRDRRAALARIIKAEILPALVVAARRHAAAPASAPAIAADPEALARALLAGCDADARALVEARLASGAPAHRIMIDDIAPAARRLGVAWAQDECDFVDVTVATHTLFALMRDLSPDDDARRAGEPALLVAPAPRETHTLGADIAAGLFRCAGWRALRCEAADMRAILAAHWFDAAGFSVSCDRFLPDLAVTIREARAAARNPGLLVIVGGPVFASAQAARGLGADYVAADGESAAQLPRSLRKALRL
jgi:methanogenic corrinoid protein MtbC1